MIAFMLAVLCKARVLKMTRQMLDITVKMFQRKGKWMPLTKTDVKLWPLLHALKPQGTNQSQEIVDAQLENSTDRKLALVSPLVELMKNL